MIGYNATLFEMVNYTTVDYDSDKLCPPTWITGNIAQIMALKHLEHPGFGIVLGNTHMYWRPNATYERLRQTAIYTERLMEFKNTLDSSTEWVPIVIGGKLDGFYWNHALVLITTHCNTTKKISTPDLPILVMLQ